MLRELWALIRIEYMIIRELNLRQKLLKHQCKMVDTYETVTREFPDGFRMIESAWALSGLEARIESGFGI